MGFTKSGLRIITEPVYGLIKLGITIELTLLSKILSKSKYLCTKDN